MADKEKVASDPIEAEGIRIGNDRFKFKTNLDLNRDPDSRIGLNSVARSPEKTISSSDNIEQKATAIASGVGSYALGPGAVAQGHYSFALGSGAYSLGKNSFCHGAYDKIPFDTARPFHSAIGVGSASFNGASAIGDYSFAEGCGQTGFDVNDTSIGAYAHAEGSGKAYGQCSHAEGYGIATEEGSHAEGFNTIAKGQFSHVEGKGSFNYNDEAKTEYEREGRTRADGTACHAEGVRTFAAGWATHTEGESAKANGLYCHARGYYSRAGGFYEDKASDYSCCSSIGNHTVATGNQSIGAGIYTRAYGENSVSLGCSTIASGQDQVVLGRLNKPKSDCAIIVGGGDNVSVNPDKAENGVVEFEGKTYIQKNILEFDWDGNLWIRGSFLYGDEKFSAISSEDLKNYYTKTEATDIFLSKEDATEHLLPTVSQSDNGKILSVVNGAWTPISIVNAEGVAY